MDFDCIFFIIVGYLYWLHYC